jgi:SAM-dependent methyltransferase
MGVLDSRSIVDREIQDQQRRSAAGLPDGKFELIYSYSVLTHLSADRQKPWMKELVRVLKPGGMFLLTVSGKRVAWRIGISAEQLQEMEERGILVLGGEQSGSKQTSCQAACVLPRNRICILTAR